MYNIMKGAIMIVNIGELITKRRDGRKRRRHNIDIIDNQPSAISIEEAKAKVQAIIDAGKTKRKNRNKND